MGLEALPEVQDESVVPPGGPGRVGRPSRKSGTFRETLPQVQDGSVGPTRGSGRVGRPSRGFKSVWDVLSEVQEVLTEVRNGS